VSREPSVATMTAITPPEERGAGATDGGRRSAALRATSLPKELLSHVAQMLDEKSLLRLSEVNRFLHDDVVTSDLFQTDLCVHCLTPFDRIDHRDKEACIPIRSKPHRRHKGSRQAGPRELRCMKELVRQRRRIARGHRFAVDEATKETCDSCRRRYLGWQVSDQAWRSRVAARRRGWCLCMPCYLAARPHDGARWRMLAAALVLCVAVFFHYFRCTLREPSSPGDDSNCYAFVPF